MKIKKHILLAVVAPIFAASTAFAANKTATLTLINKSNVPFTIMQYSASGKGSFENQPTTVPPGATVNIEMSLPNLNDSTSVAVGPSTYSSCMGDPRSDSSVCSLYQFTNTNLDPDPNSASWIHTDEDYSDGASGNHGFIIATIWSANKKKIVFRAY